MKKLAEGIIRSFKRSPLFRITVYLFVVCIVLVRLGGCIMWMPGKSHRGPLPTLTDGQVARRDALRRDLEKLAGEIGDRNLYAYENLNAAADFIEASFAAAAHEVSRQAYEIDEKVFYNIEAELKGVEKPEEILVFGAHYDSVPGCPAANDNGTGVVAVLALARAFAGKKTERTLRFVAFANEEPPHFQSKNMGSWVYAKRCRQREEKIVGMLTPETIGCYSDEKGSQKYPFPFNLFYPSTGNFIAFVGNLSSRKLVRNSVGTFRRHVKFPSEGAALPEFIPAAGLSDHWAFWQEGYEGLMITDTAFYRYQYYHTAEDTPDKIDYDRLARVVDGLEAVLAELAGADEGSEP